MAILSYQCFEMLCDDPDDRQSGADDGRDGRQAVLVPCVAAPTDMPAAWLSQSAVHKGSLDLILERLSHLKRRWFVDTC
jgi:hypothetical protein